jgi:DNA modification methylase
MGPSPKHTYKLNWQSIFYLIGPEAPPLDCESLNEQFSVQDVSAPDGRFPDGRFHAWEKPIELAHRFIHHSTREGNLVIDPFVGTGTFLLAAMELGRQGVGSENSEEMLKICEKRGLKIS